LDATDSCFRYWQLYSLDRTRRSGVR
jgi:hypothetical protein